MTRIRLWGAFTLAASLAVPGALAQGPATPATAAGAITATPLAPPPGVTGQPLVAPAAPATAPAAPEQPPGQANNTTGATRPASSAPGQPPGQPTDAAGTTPPVPGAPAPPAPGAPAQAGTAPTYTPAPPVPAVWQPGTDAVLQVLDKIDAQSSDLTVKVGNSVQYRSLTIAVRACDASTKDEKTDATAFLDITDSHPDEPSFHGWILKSNPSVSMLQHPIYDVRILACHA